MDITDKEKEVLRKIGSMGGKATLRKHGKEHYRKLAAHMNQIKKDKKPPVDN